MKIILSAPNFFPQSFGGGEMYVYRLAKELLKRGYLVSVLTPVKWPIDKKSLESSVIQKYIYNNIPVISVSLNPDKVSFDEKTTGYGPVSIELMKRIVKEYSPELIHINGMKTTMVFLSDELQIPHVVTAHHTGIVCPAGGLISYDGAVCKEKICAYNCIPCCCRWKRPKWYIGGLMGSIPGWIYKSLGKRLHTKNKMSYVLRGLITPWIVEESIRQKRIVMEKAQMIIAPSNFMKDLLVKGGCDPEKIVVIPHGIEPIGTLAVENIKNRLLRFGYIGRIDPLKGLHLLLEATEFLRNGSSCEVHLFGAARNPWDEEYLKKTLSIYKGKAKLINHGLIPHEELKEVFEQIDVLVVPSILPEAFGFVVAEAFSAAKPVIVFNSGALPEQVKDGLNGFVIQQNDAKTLSEAIQRFIDNPDLTTEMSKNIPHIKTMQEYGDEIEKVYLHVVHEKDEGIDH
jgi:glycosyltransferase involved in cell wall biosynthesis